MTRRLVITLALGSTTGAGIGAAWIGGAATPPSQPQLGSQPQAGSAQQPADSQPQAGSQAGAQPLSQPLSQQLPRFLWPNSLLSKQPPFLAQGSQQLSQAGASQPHAGATSQPQAGSAAQQSPAASQPHAGSAAQQPADSQPQAGSQAGAHPLSHPLSHPQLRFLCAKSFDSKPPCRFFAQGSQQPVSQAGASQPQAGAATSQPQAGSASQQAGPAAQQVGSAAQQVGSAAQQSAAGASHPQAGPATSQPQSGPTSQQAGASHPASQQLLALPHPFIPIIRSKRSNPKLWLQILQPTTRAIVIIVRFIGATSPFLNLAVRFFRSGP